MDAPQAIPIDGHDFPVRAVTEVDTRLAIEYVSGLIGDNKILLGGRPPEEVVDDWLRSEDGLAYVVYLMVRDAYRRRLGKTLSPGRVRWALGVHMKRVRNARATLRHGLVHSAGPFWRKAVGLMRDAAGRVKK
jgi:hypothetical protein